MTLHTDKLPSEEKPLAGVAVARLLTYLSGMGAGCAWSVADCRAFLSLLTCLSGMGALRISAC